MITKKVGKELCLMGACLVEVESIDIPRHIEERLHAQFHGLDVAHV